MPHRGTGTPPAALSGLREDRSRVQLLPNRHCPKCQARAAQRWLEARQVDLSPVLYYHVVPTLPAPISALAHTNKAMVIYRLLFEKAAQTLQTIASDPRHLGAQIGLTLVLHTWGSALTRTIRMYGWCRAAACHWMVSVGSRAGRASFCRHQLTLFSLFLFYTKRSCQKYFFTIKILADA